MANMKNVSAGAEFRGLGTSSRAQLAAIGITKFAQLQAADPFQLFLVLREKFPGISMNMLYALIGAQQDRDWRDVAKSDKIGILMRLDDMQRVE